MYLYHKYYEKGISTSFVYCCSSTVVSILYSFKNHCTVSTVVKAANNFVLEHCKCALCGLTPEPQIQVHTFFAAVKSCGYKGKPHYTCNERLSCTHGGDVCTDAVISLVFLEWKMTWPRSRIRLNLESGGHSAYGKPNWSILTLNLSRP